MGRPLCFFYRRISRICSAVAFACCLSQLCSDGVSICGGKVTNPLSLEPFLNPLSLRPFLARQARALSPGDPVSWILDHGSLLGALGALGLASLVASVVLLPFLVVRNPPGNFCHERREHEYVRDRHPAVHQVIVILKNALGVLLILAGLAMLVLPGQGLLTPLIGLMLTDLPGKYRQEKRLIAQPGVLKGANWLRARAGHAPLEPPIDGGGV